MNSKDMHSFDDLNLTGGISRETQEYAKGDGKNAPFGKRGHGRSGLGRKGRDNQEIVIKLDAVREKVQTLIDLYKLTQETAADLNDGIKAVAESSGLLASVVRKFVVARAGDKFKEKAREVEQLSLIFEVGE